MLPLYLIAFLLTNLAVILAVEGSESLVVVLVCAFAVLLAVLAHYAPAAGAWRTPRR